MYINTKFFHIIIIIVILIVSINTALKSVNDKFDIIGKFFNNNISKSLYILIGVFSLLLLLDRNTYLPFLGESAVPFTLFTDITNSTSNLKDYKIYAPNAEKVIWWASRPDNTIFEHPDEAYHEYKNSGVSSVKEDGYAYIKYSDPSQYKVNKKLLPKHIHYRETHGGMLSEVKTIIL